MALALLTLRCVVGLGQMAFGWIVLTLSPLAMAKADFGVGSACILFCPFGILLKIDKI